MTTPLDGGAQQIYATSQDNGTSGLCLGCGVTNPQNDVTNTNLSDYSTLQYSLGLLNVSVYQDLIFPSVDANPGCDSLVVAIGNSSSLLGIALSGGVTLETYDGATANGDVTTVSSNDLGLLVNDTLEGLVFVLPAKPFDRVRVSLNASLAGTFNSLRVYYAYTDKTVLTAPTVTSGDSVSVCAGSSSTLTATPSAGATGVDWYTVPSGGTAVFSGTSYTVSPSSTTVYYAESDLAGCASPTRTPVTVLVNPVPAVPSLVNAAQTVCSGVPATFTVSNPQAGFTYNWYTVSTGGTPTASGASFTVTDPTASQDYYVEAESASGCISATRAQAALTVNPSPDSTTISGPDTVTVSQGQSATFTVGNPNASFTYNWYDAPTGGDLLFTGTTFTTPAEYAPVSYYVAAVSNQACTAPSRTRVVVEVTTPTTLTCGLANSQQSPVDSGVCLGCTVSNPNLAVDGDPSTASTISTVVGASGYVGQVLDFPNTYPAGDSIVLELSVPSETVSTGLLGGIRVQTYLNGTANNDAQTLSAPNASVQILGSGSGAQFQVKFPAQNAFNGVLVAINNSVSLMSSLDVYYGAALVPRGTVASGLLTDCGPESDTLRATGPAGANFSWYSVPVGGTTVDSSATYVTPSINSNTTYYLQASQFGCPNPVRTPVVIDVNTPPAPPTINTPDETICSGDSATLVATPPSGAAVEWYSQPSGGTALDSSNSLNTHALSATTPYYAQSSEGGCSSTSRSVDSVYVNPTPQPVAVNPSGTEISPGQSASLTASSPTPGVQFNWYTQDSAGAPVFTGTTFTVSPATTTTYYVAAVSPTTGCTTARTPVTVTVLSDNGPQVPCGSATSQTSSVNGLCIGCSVQNGALAVDSNEITGSTLSVPLGLAGGSVSQTLIFPFTAVAGDTIRIKLVFPSSIGNPSLLGNVSVQTFNGSTSNNDSTTINTGPAQLDLLAGDDSALVTFVPAAPYDRVEVVMNSGTAGLLSQLNIDYATSITPAPVLQSDTVTICSGQQATLTITKPAGATFSWFSSSSGGSALGNGATFQTPVLTDTTTYYAQSASSANGCVNSARTPSYVFVLPAPSAPTVQQSSVSVCTGSPATLIASAPAGLTLLWYTSASGGSPVFTGDTLVTPALDSSITYYVSSTNPSGCTSSSRTPVTASVAATPATPVVMPASDTLCAGGTATFAASSSTGGATFNWYTSAAGDTVVFTGPTFTTPVLNSNAEYYVGASIGSCASASRATATAVVNPLPSAPTATVSPTGTVDAGSTATLTASSATPNVTFNWYTTASGGSPVFTGNPFTTPELTSTVTYYVEAVSNDGSGCPSATRTPVTITVQPAINLSCGVANNQTNAVNGLCGGCSVTNAGFAVDADTTTASSLSLGGATSGSITQTLIFPGVSQAGDTIQIELGTPGTALTSQVEQAIQLSTADGATSNNDAQNLTASDLNLNVEAASDKVIVRFAPASAYDRVTVTISAGVAPALSTLNVYYATTQVNAPRAGSSNVTICSGNSATLTASVAPDAFVQWFGAPTGGAALNSGDTLVTPALSATTVYYAEALSLSDSCANQSRVPVTVSVLPVPPVPTVSPNPDTICAGQSAQLTASVTGPVSVIWYDSATGGQILSTGSVFTTPALSLSTTYYAAGNNGTCSSAFRDTVEVVVGQAPATPSVSPADTSICQGQSLTLQVAQPQAGVTYNWYLTLSGGSPFFSGASLTTPALSSGATYYVEAVNSITNCAAPSARTSVVVNVSPIPSTPAVTAAQVSACMGQPASMSVASPAAGTTYQWYSAASGGSLLFTGPTYTITQLTQSDSLYVQALTSGSTCASPSRTVVAVTADSVPSTPQVQIPNQTICLGSSATFSINPLQAGSAYSWYDAPAGGNLLGTGTAYTTPILNVNATYYASASNSITGCPAISRTPVTATVTNNLPAPQLVSNEVGVCVGQTATVSVANPQGGVVYDWYNAPTGGALLAQGSAYTIPNPTNNSDYYVTATTPSGACTSTSSTEAEVFVSSPPAAPSLVTSNIQVCSGGNVTLTVSSPQNGLVYNWYTVASGGIPVFTGTALNVDDVTASTTYYLEAADSGCGSASRAAANISVEATAANPSVTASDSAVCAGNNAVLTATSTTAGALFDWYSSASGGTPIGTGNTFTTGALTSDTTFYVEASASDGCSDSILVPITVVQLQPLATPDVRIEYRTTTYVIFEWDPVPGAVAYEVSLNNGASFGPPSSGPTGLTDSVGPLSPNQAVTIMARALGMFPCQTSTASGQATGVSANQLGDDIFVPNIFSPNGDGVNDILYVYSNAISSMVFRIYNQWGQELFESRNVSTGWDGTYDGKPQPVGVYVYVLQATMQDGTIINKKGSVSIIR